MSDDIIRNGNGNVRLDSVVKWSQIAVIITLFVFFTSGSIFLFNTLSAKADKDVMREEIKRVEEQSINRDTLAMMSLKEDIKDVKNSLDELIRFHTLEVENHNKGKK